MEAAVSELHLRFDTDSPGDAPAVDAVGEVAEQGALARACLPPQDRDPAVAGLRIGQERVERLALDAPSEQLGTLGEILARRAPPSQSKAN
jgi:hypothetical protein